VITIDYESTLSAEYATKRYAVIRHLVDPEVAAAWELKYRALPGRKVNVGRDYQATWTEQKIGDPSGALEGLLRADRFINLITAITSLKAIDCNRTEIWINRYSPGDHVPRHCDWAGSTQLVLCLQGLPEPEKGGDLVIRDEVVPLRAGDAVLFFARGLPHEIHPILSAKVGPSGCSRVTCVIRLYALDDPEGASS
jgi:hypothetical protein